MGVYPRIRKLYFEGLAMKILIVLLLLSACKSGTLHHELVTLSEQDKVRLVSKARADAAKENRRIAAESYFYCKIRGCHENTTNQ